MGMNKRQERTRMSMLRFLEEKRQAEREKLERDNTIRTLHNSGLFSIAAIAEIMGVAHKTAKRAVRKEESA